MKFWLMPRSRTCVAGISISPLELVHTKIYPTANWTPGPEPEAFTLSVEDMDAPWAKVFDALKSESVDLWYLHAPDRNTPLEVTMQVVDKFHREGKFKCLGISNFKSREVAQMCELCDRHGWIRPSVYQGTYNPLHRAIEAELLPCLRHCNIALYAFRPLAGDLLTGRYQLEPVSFDSGTQYDPNNKQSSVMTLATGAELRLRHLGLSRKLLNDILLHLLSV